MNGSEFKKEIENIIKEARKNCPNITDEMLDAGGAIYYMNGKNSTRFDWEVNYQISAFSVFHKDERGFIKVFVGRNSKVTVYIYEDGGMYPTHEYKTKLECGPAWRLFKVMLGADAKRLFDKSINELDWDIEV